MKVATYTPRLAQPPCPGIAAVTDEFLVDLNYGYARYVRDVERESRAHELAAARVPRDMIGFLEGGTQSIEAAQHTVDFVTSKLGSEARGLLGERILFRHDEVRLLPPVPRPGKILAAGKNYAEHAKEGGGDGATQPFPRGFVKLPDVVIGPDDAVELPHVTEQLDYEVELAVVIGKRGRYIPREAAYDHVAGYTILNDVSARDIQLEESQYGNHMIGKNMDTLAPMGPWIALTDEIPDPMALDLQLSVNGEIRQQSNTSNMIHDIPAMIERWSWVTLEPGDVIATGTPAGVALGGKHPYLAPGDIMECVIERVGTLRNQVVEGPR